MSAFLSSLVTSEFVWGTILGSVLTIVGALMAARIQRRRFTEIITRFCEDTIANVCEFIENMNDHRNRGAIIHPEFLGLIETELVVYGRNREHLIHIDDKDLRRDIRDFFARVSVQLTIVRQNLTLFDQAWNRAQPLPLGLASGEASQHQRNADMFLSQAHKACDAMVSLAAKQGELRRRLAGLL
jgi:hypothetical protein